MNIRKALILGGSLLLLAGCQTVKDKYDDFFGPYNPGDISKAVFKSISLSNDAMELIAATQNVKDNYLEVRDLVRANAAAFGDDIKILRRLDALVTQYYYSVNSLKQSDTSFGTVLDIVDLAKVLSPMIPLAQEAVLIMDKAAPQLPDAARAKYQVARQDVNSLLVLAEKAVQQGNRSERFKRAIALAKSLAAVLAAGIEIKAKIDTLSQHSTHLKT